MTRMQEMYVNALLLKNEEELLIRIFLFFIID